MEIELTRISFEADIYDVRKAVATVLHGPDLFDPNHNRKAILRVGSNPQDLQPFQVRDSVPLGVKQTLEKALYIDLELEKDRLCSLSNRRASPAGSCGNCKSPLWCTVSAIGLF